MSPPEPTAPPKVDSRQVYAIAREIVGPLAKELGFRREKAMLSYTRPEGDLHLTFWFQVSQWGWDKYSGSEFVVEFQLSPESVVGTGLHRARLAALLTESEREAVRERQNGVISRLRTPPASYIEALFSSLPDTKASYLDEFKPVTKAYYDGQDIWFRYGSEEDVREWCVFIKSKLPTAIDRFFSKTGRI